MNRFGGNGRACALTVDGLFSCTPALIGFWSHSQFNCSTLHQLLMTEPVFIKYFTVQGSMLNIFINDRTVFCNQGKCPAVLQFNGHLTEYRASNRVFRYTRRCGIKSHGGENNKGGHASAILISRNAKNIILKPQ